ncbi:MAG: ABC transporter permease subunit [candidate division Zixibacteria bacterium]|nr:ABC transporter permease subunit [candidate division Zixibacteria bacterium]
MLITLIEKELKAILQSPKFVATFAVCSLLMLLSVFIGIKEFQAQQKQYDVAVSLSEQGIQESTSWRGMSYKAYRKPDPMQIFVSGLTNDIGRWSHISQESSVKLRNSVYSDDPIFSVFRFIDFAFIVQVVLSLFAILFTYDAICGERENGTLKLLFSNAIKRSHYIIAKCVGSWLGLVVPIMIPILLSVLMVIAFGISLEGSDWLKLFGLMSMSIFLFTFFIVLGVFISSLTRRSNISFLFALVIWVTFVLIIPRAGVMAAGQILPVPRVAEIEGQRDAFAKDKWAIFNEKSMARWDSYNQNTSEDSDSSCGSNFVFDENELWEHMQKEDSARKIVEREIEAYETRLQEDLQQRKSGQERLAFSLSRFSPSSAYQLAAMTLAGTDINLKSRNIEVMNNYRTQFNNYVDNKISETNDLSGVFMIEISSDDGVKMNNKRDEQTIDASDMPKYIPAKSSMRQSIDALIIDGGLLGLFIILAFAGAFLRMQKYDVR